jgi:hypothetical protein
MPPRRSHSIWLVVVSRCLLAQASVPAAAGEPSPRELIDLAPVISSSDENCRSIEIGGYLRQDGPACLTFRAIYRAPDHYAVLIKDKADGTPLFFAADRQMFLYDPVSSVLLWNADNNVSFSLVHEGDALRIHLGATSDKDKPSNVLLDVRSLLARPSVNDKVVQTGEKKYRLTRTTEKGNSLDLGIDLDRKQPYTNIAITIKGSTEPFVCISDININGNLDQAEAFFPKRDEPAQKIGVQNLPGSALKRHGSELTLLMRACNARSAINQPELREAIDLGGFSDVDWQHVKNNDEKISRVLREALKAASLSK